MAGSITHRKINLPDGYRYYPQSFQGFKVSELIISNQNAKVLWPGLIDIQGIDFSNALELDVYEADIIDDRLNMYAMEITMMQLPKNV